jgi:hypothetical protein
MIDKSFSRLEVMEVVAAELALALSCLRMTKGVSNGLIDQAVQDALDLYEECMEAAEESAPDEASDVVVS